VVVEQPVVGLLLAADAEEAVARPGDHHHPHARVVARDLVTDLEEDVRVGHDATPSFVGVLGGG
jgi:hypothetical protein